MTATMQIQIHSLPLARIALLNMGSIIMINSFSMWIKVYLPLLQHPGRIASLFLEVVFDLPTQGKNYPV